MPGPVSDAYDPEFGTAANAGNVREAIEKQIAALTDHLGPGMKSILDIVDGPAGRRLPPRRLSERDARIIRFALNRAIQSL